MTWTKVRGLILPAARRRRTTRWFFSPNQLPWPSPSAEKVWFPGRRKSHSQKRSNVVNKNMVFQVSTKPSPKKRHQKKTHLQKKKTPPGKILSIDIQVDRSFSNKKIGPKFRTISPKTSGFSRPSRGSWGIRTLDQCHRRYTWGRPGLASKRQRWGKSKVIPGRLP